MQRQPYGSERKIARRDLFFGLLALVSFQRDKLLQGVTPLRLRKERRM
ncbi:hypothetical protein CSUI_005517 [Cystoisospora suis]|uniref:Uncharacterized protein n=1 Tax=Cystoisospora suis TaxID=483139 RepID=A0A2C6KXA0_9APIC|nr:hypothetical protein CSUI_005517 [Cystoisospora suis]